jgi:hypothetical protein
MKKSISPAVAVIVIVVVVIAVALIGFAVIKKGGKTDVPQQATPTDMSKQMMGGGKMATGSGMPNAAVAPTSPGGGN